MEEINQNCLATSNIGTFTLQAQVITYTVHNDKIVMINHQSYNPILTDRIHICITLQFFLSYMYL